MKSDASASRTAAAGKEMPWVLVRVGSGLFALSTSDVRDMVSTPQVHAVPEAPAHVRGVVNLRGTVMPLVDVRRRFGQPSLAEESAALVELLQHREKDHRHWIDELEASVRERRHFGLTTDPHACAFGKWYDTFKTDNLILETLLKRFNEPHRHVHAVGSKVTSLAEANRHDDALALIESTRASGLSVLLSLFEEVYRVIRTDSREIAVVLTGGIRPFAAAVDSIESVERLPTAHITEMSDVGAGLQQEYVTAIGRRTKDNALVMIVDGNRLLGDVALN